MGLALEYPFYLVVDRHSGNSIEKIVPAILEIPVAIEVRRSIVTYSMRGAAAAFLSREGGQRLRLYPVFSGQVLDRLAILALTRFRSPWLALEPDRSGLDARAFMDLKAWIEAKRPLEPALEAFWRAMVPEDRKAPAGA